MKKMICILALLLSLTGFAASSSSAVEWVLEARTIVINGETAKDLYNSLNAGVSLDPLSTKYDQLRTKKNKFAKCSASFYRADLPNGDTEWEIQDNAICQITAPLGTTINQ